MREVCLNVAPVHQPSPARNPGGDCFACSLTAALRHVYGRDDISFDDCWECFKTERGALYNCWPGMRAALYAASGKFYDYGRLEIEVDFVQPYFDPQCFAHQRPTFDAGRYADRLEGHLRSGWIALVEYDHHGAGPVSEGRWNAPDHFALIDGVRTFWKPVAAVPGASGEAHEIHIVCSARGAFWIDLDEFAFKHGAGAWWLVRKDER